MTTVSPTRLATAATAATLANDGATVSAVTFDSPSWGYAVALPGREETITLTTDPRQSTVELEAILEDYVRRHRAILATPNRYVGTWLHQGTIFLDVSEVIQDRAAALDAAWDRHQIAIFDLLRGEEISVNTGAAALSDDDRAEAVHHAYEMAAVAELAEEDDPTTAAYWN